MSSGYICSKCKESITDSDAYEYRGAIACVVCIDAVSEHRDHQRQQIIQEEGAKTNVFKGLDMSSDTSVGKANRELLKKHIEIASKESARIKEYESGKDPT